MYLETKNDVFSGNLLVIVRNVALWGDFQESHFQEELTITLDNVCIVKS
jgi:hypothetical protein